jgi:benzoyl-CoA reductase/2-hydroxyglutaryl-CoA dehydratase subunit BcrC/BadD/HgdB
MSAKTLEKIQSRLKQRPAELEEARKAGATVIGWSGYLVPEEIIYALGLIPIRIGTGGDDRLVEIGSRYISSKNCVYTRELVGLVSQNEDPFIRNVDAYAFDATCLQLYRAAELIEYYFSKEIFVLAVPRNYYLGAAREYLVSDAEGFAKKLEEKAGRALDSAALQSAIDLFGRIRSSLERLYSLQAAQEPVLSWIEVYDAIQAGYYLDRAEYAGLLEELLAEAETLEPISGEEGKPRLFISGSVIPPGDRKLINIIQSLGGRIVGDELWSGIVPYLDVHIASPTVRDVVLGHLDRIPHAALPYMDLATDRRVKRLAELVEQSNADAIIYHTLRYCDPFSFKAKETKDVFAPKGVALLEIHTEYAGSDFESIRTRVEAFLEMVSSRSFAANI